MLTPLGEGPRPRFAKQINGGANRGPEQTCPGPRFARYEQKQRCVAHRQTSPGPFGPGLPLSLFVPLAPSSQAWAGLRSKSTDGRRERRQRHRPRQTRDATFAQVCPGLPLSAQAHLRPGAQVCVAKTEVDRVENLGRFTK
jgi:hypothetical protein